MELLSGLDSLFIHHETPHAPLHVLAVMNVSRRRAPYPLTAETYRRLIAARIDEFPGLCKKLVDPPLPIAPPLWIRTQPDLRIHVREIDLATSSEYSSFNEFLTTYDAQPLDRTRPLWELTIVHEEDSDDSHLIAKAHHALLDGIAGFELVANIFDADENGADEDLSREHVLSHVDEENPDWMTHYGATLVSQPFTWAQSSIKVARNVLTFAKSTLDGATPSASYPWRAPSWPEKRTLTSARAMSHAHFLKSDVKKIRQAYGASFHDVLGAVTAGALRSVALSNGTLPDEPLVCVSPVSVRRKRATHGNELSVMFAQLPTHLEDPHERVVFMKESFTNAKSFLDSLGADTLGEISRLAPWAAIGALWSRYSESGISEKHPPFANIMLSSLPGPSFPLYCAGTQVQSAYPYGPIFDGSLLNITAISYLDTVNCGIVSCPDSFSEVDALAGALVTSLNELTADE